MIKRLVPISRQLPSPEMLKDFLKFKAPGTDFRAQRLAKAADVWDLRNIAKKRPPKEVPSTMWTAQQKASYHSTAPEKPSTI